MFSGGMDSTYIAWKMMKNKIGKLHLHHASIRNDSDPLWKQQDRAVKLILDYFRKQGFEFGYSESIFEFFGWEQVGFDSDLLLLIGQKIAQNFDGKVELFIGWNPYDMERLCIADRSCRNVTNNIWLSLVESARNRKHIDKNLHFPLIEDNLRKADIIEEMPKELLDLTWSCRKSKTDTPCGSCHACIEIQDALKKP